jgi:hypothetical protein
MPEIKVLREPAPLPPATGLVVTLSLDEMREIYTRFPEARYSSSLAFQAIIQIVHDVLK